MKIIGSVLSDIGDYGLVASAFAVLVYKDGRQGLNQALLSVCSASGLGGGLIKKYRVKQGQIIVMIIAFHLIILQIHFQQQQ